jgi:hypothetical protein
METYQFAINGRVKMEKRGYPLLDLWLNLQKRLIQISG